MSRGLGIVQRRVLEILNADDQLHDTFELAARAFDVALDENGRRLLTEAQVVSVRRALGKLVRVSAVVNMGSALARRSAAVGLPHSGDAIPRQNAGGIRPLAEAVDTRKTLARAMDTEMSEARYGAAAAERAERQFCEYWSAGGIGTPTNDTCGRFSPTPE